MNFGFQIPRTHARERDGHAELHVAGASRGRSGPDRPPHGCFRARRRSRAILTGRVPYVGENAIEIRVESHRARQLATHSPCSMLLAPTQS